MKLRLRANTVRMRLSQTEVAQLLSNGLVEDAVEFQPNPLVYTIHSSTAAAKLEATFVNGWITVTVPEQRIQSWAEGPDVGISGTTRGISVLIEKDWPCVHGTSAENEDTFPRPADSPEVDA